VRLAVLSDTHARPLPPACAAHLRAADLVVHAGDVGTAAALAELEGLSRRLVVVAGNVDEPALGLPETAWVPELALAVVHDAGPAKGRLERLRRRFPDARLVVFGHSHIPLEERAEDGFRILNPGSATQRRRQPRHTMAVGEDLDLRLIAL
jgi:uncharacterized protein